MLNLYLTGNLGADPEIRYTPDGTKMVTFTVAVNQKKRNRDGEDQDKTTWFRIRCIGWTAESAESLEKGSRVLVSGRLDVDTFERRDGGTGTSLDVRADALEVFARRPRDDDASERTERSPRTPAAAARPTASAPASARSSAAAAPVDSSDLEDLPFIMPRHIQEPWLFWRAP